MRERRKPEYLQDYVCVANVADPVTIDEALRRDDVEKWKKPIDDELNSNFNNIWSIVDNIPIGRKAVKSKVFNLKKGEDGKI